MYNQGLAGLEGAVDGSSLTADDGMSVTLLLSSDYSDDIQGNSCIHIYATPTAVTHTLISLSFSWASHLSKEIGWVDFNLVQIMREYFCFSV